MSPPKTWLALLGRLALFIILVVVAASLVILPFATVLTDWVDANPAIAQLCGEGFSTLALLAATWIMTRFVDRRPFVSIGFETTNIGRDFGSGIATGTAWLGLSIGVLWIAGWASPTAPAGFALLPLLGGLLVVLFNVVTQQLIICGYLFQTIRSKAGFPVAVFVSALLFAGLHVPAFEGAWLPPLNVFAAGVIFCLAYGLSGNLWLGIGIHFAWNMLLGPVLGLTVSGSEAIGLGWQAFQVEGPDLATGGAFGVEGGLVSTTTASILIAALLFLVHRSRHADDTTIDPHEAP